MTDAATSWANASWTRIVQVLTADAERSGSVFGFAPVVAPEATGSFLSAEGHASGPSDTANIVVSAGPGDESRRRSKALGVLHVGPSPQAVFHTGGLRRTADSRRIPQRVTQVG
ncbi:nuclear transport factor 2 family protein [Streptomyces sp. 2A115]|uniref:nuclear transport factor 2 family protein n=1 Tax=Streptomyces sp. 2A115 TaxID=3457439 RepID=UPI003FD4DED4